MWTSITKAAREVSSNVSNIQQTLALIGFSVLAVVAIVFARPDMAEQVSQQGAPAPVMVASAAQTDALVQPAKAASKASGKAAPTAETAAHQHNLKQQQFVTNWLSKRYRKANEHTNLLVSTAYTTAKETKLDPLLILAVMAIESGLNPFAESPMGAQGLMQVMSKVHHARFKPMGGVQAAFHPVANIRVGSQILKEYVKRGGSVEAGLKTYVGAAAFATDQGYGSKVMAEWARLKLVAKGKNVPTFTRPPAPKPAPVEVSTPEPQSETVAIVLDNEPLASLQGAQ